jgi:hypothetical protein
VRSAANRNVSERSVRRFGVFTSKDTSRRRAFARLVAEPYTKEPPKPARIECGFGAGRCAQEEPPKEHIHGRIHED